MRRSITSDTRNRPHPARAFRSRVAQVFIGLTLVTAVATANATGASALPPPPANPSDTDIAAATAQVGAASGQVGDLIGAVAAANQQLAEIADDVAVKREAVNKALVDLQNARSAADAAAAAVSVAQQALAGAGQVIVDARNRFTSFAIADYVKGTGAAGFASLLASAGPQEMLDRAQLLRQITAQQNATLDGLQRARADQANKDSTARQSQQAADAASADADARKVDAQNAIDTAISEQQAQQQRAATVTAQRDAAQNALDQARGLAADLAGQRTAFDQWDQQRRTEQAAMDAANAAARDAAAAAATRVAANAAANQLAAYLADGDRSHTDLDSAPALATTPKKTGSTTATTPAPTVTGSAAVETVIDRGMSQLGVSYSWGGGNENGPTKGIRDGGVADSYGDYNKVGFDCSGLMIYAFAGIGISLPHYTGYQYTTGRQVPSSQMKRGDMVFYGPNASQHVALYLGDGKMLEAPQSGDVVKISPLRQSGMTPFVVRLVD